VLAECVYVLESFYEVEPPQVAAVLRAVIAFPSIETVDSAVLLRALEVYELDRLDFAEAYLIALAEVTGVKAIISFDRSIGRRSPESNAGIGTRASAPARAGRRSDR
jgi:predicted nucleic-acid-binding protein